MSAPRSCPRLRTGLGRAPTAIGASVVAATSLCSAYLGVVTLAAVVPRSRSMGSSANRTFAVLVPAHDEAAVIARTLDSFAALDYPADRFTVHVVADNCTDETAEIVRRSGFTVHDRDDIENPGKGPALNWLVAIVDQQETAPDAYVIVDADTTLDAHFLTAMDEALVDGVQAAQGFYGVHDPAASTPTALRFIALSCRHHLRPLGRTRLGGTSGLFGNGMAFTRELLCVRQWTGHLVEDAEFQLELLLDGVLVAYTPGARLAAEMPGTLAGSTTQHERWELGRFQIARRFAPTLLRRSLRPTTFRRHVYLDAVLDLVVPPLSVLAGLQVVGLAWATAARAVTGSAHHRALQQIAVASCVLVACHVLAGPYSVQAPRSVYGALRHAPSAIAWKVSLWARVLTSGNDVTWIRTQRNAELAAARC